MMAQRLIIQMIVLMQILIKTLKIGSLLLKNQEKFKILFS